MEILYIIFLTLSIRYYIDVIISVIRLPYAQAFVFINAETGCLYSDVSHEILLHGEEIPPRLLSLSQLSVAMVNRLMDRADLLHHLDVSRVVTVLYLRPVASSFQSRL